MDDFKRRYFTDEEGYPGLRILNAQPGCFYEYVSGPLLDFVSLWVKRPYVRGALITRYRTYEENLVDYQKLIGPPAPRHFSVSDSVDDDLIVLAKGADPVGPPHNEEAWWVIWFDRDCSDCCLGYFVTKDSGGMVIDSFTSWVNGLSKEMGYQPEEHQGPALFIPVQSSDWWKW